MGDGARGETSSFEGRSGGIQKQYRALFITISLCILELKKIAPSAFASGISARATSA